MKKKTLIGSLLLVGGLLAACGGEEESTDNSVQSDAGKNTYIIATDAKYAPFSFEEGGVYKGIDVELLAAIAEEEGFEYELKPMDFSGIIPGIVSGQIDASIAGMNITEKRKESVDFSDGYIKAGSSIIVNAATTDVSELDDLQGKTAAVKKGTTGATFAEENEEKYELKISYYDDSPSMKAAVENGNADFMVEDYPVISYQIAIDAGSKLKIAIPEIADPPQNGFAVKKGENQELLQQFNDGLAKIQENGKYDEIIGQYIKE